MSLPSRERGLKFNNLIPHPFDFNVAPFAGAWIEICPDRAAVYGFYVAPFAGAWIEIFYHTHHSFLRIVAPFAGAWIEIIASSNSCLTTSSVAPFAGAWIEIMI